LLEEVGDLAHAVLADLVELHDPLLAIAVMRGGMERLVRSAFREDAVLRVASGLERGDARHVGLEREHLKVEQQGPVVGERGGETGRGVCGESGGGPRAGASGSARASPLRFCASTAWIRRSISRTLSR